MLCAVLMNLPVHAGGLLVVDLHAVHPAIALAGCRVLREHDRHSDVTPAVCRPALDDRKVIQRELAVLEYSLLAVAVFDDLRKHMSKVGKPRNHFDLLYEALRRLYI